MSLNYELTNTSLTRDDEGHIQWTNATEALIWFTMSVGIGDLSEKNAPEFWARVNLLQTLNGTPEAHRITAADIKQHIGMTTNVFTTEPRTKWVKRIIGERLDNSVLTFADAAEESTQATIREWPEDATTT